MTYPMIAPIKIPASPIAPTNIISSMRCSPCATDFGSLAGRA
jgi:hypothetical protein